MPDLRGFRYLLVLSGLIALVGIFGCDEAPELHRADQPATYGGVEVTLGDYSIRYLELTDESGETYEYPDPVLVLPVTLTNKGEDELVYNPTHGTQQMSEASTPLLFPAPSTPEIVLKELTRQPITGVYLERGQVDDQVQRSTTLASGESLTDVFLFELPDPNQEVLILSIPPSMHRANLPIFLRIDYREPTPEGPNVYAIGNSMEFDGVVVTVLEVEQAYIKLEDSSRGKGYSTDPVLKISYEVKNETEETVTFDPSHRDLSGRQGATLHSLHTEFNRIRFPSTATPEGQQGRVQIEPGESITDFAVFERPQESVESATFELAASHFDRAGRVRVSISYQREDVEKPEEMQASD